MINIDYPVSLRPEDYDLFLEKGWFRSSFMMYRSEVLCINKGVSSVINIRWSLYDYKPKKRHAKLLVKNDSIFEVSVKNLKITEEANALYQQQTDSFQGFIHSNLWDYFFADRPHDLVPYNTKQIEVRKDGELVAISFFDIGKNAMASILGLYKQELKSFGLGNYTMLKEMEYGKKVGIEYFYPGYILDLESSFNYKLSFAPCEYLNNESEWLSFDHFKSEDTKAYEIREKTEKIKSAMSANNIQGKTMYYPYFSFGYLSLPYEEQTFLNRALFFILETPVKGSASEIISYDLKLDLFFHEAIIEHAFPETYLNVTPSPEYTEDENCLMSLYYKEVLDTDRDIEKLIQRLNS